MNLAAGVISALVLLVLLIYTIAQPEPLLAGLLSAVPGSVRDRVQTAVRRSMEQLQSWAFGSLIVGLIVGVVTGVALHLMGVPYALLFAVIAAIGEMIPTIGPILAAVPPVLLMLVTDPWMALWVVVLFLVIQQLESNVLTPLVLGGRMHLHPVSIVFSILVMHSLFGLVGAILAVPVTAILKVCWEEFYLNPRGRDPEEVKAEASDLVTENGASEERERHGGPGRPRPVRSVFIRRRSA